MDFFALCVFFTCFLVVLAVAGAGLVLVAAGVLACWPANANGLDATARAIPSKFFFMAFFSLAGFFAARSQFHVAPKRLKAR